MTSETDAEFLDRFDSIEPLNPNWRPGDSARLDMPDFARLFALARRGAEAERLRVENIQMQAALGYAICAEDERHIIPSNPFKCGVCDANRGVHARIEQLEAALREIAKLAQRNQMGLLATNDAFGKTWQIVRAALEERT